MDVLSFCLLILAPVYSYSQIDEFQSLFDELQKSGHRDIIITQHSDYLKVYYWPIGFRDDYKGFVDIKDRITEYISDNKNINSIELIQTSWGIPLVTASLQRNSKFKNIKFSKKYENPVESDGYYRQKRPKRLMVLLDIPLNANFGQPYDPFVFKTGISTEFRYMLYQGILAYGRMEFYFHNEYDPRQFYKPGNIGLMIARTFHDNIISATNIGAFSPDIYGIDEEIRFSLLDDRFSMTMHGGMYGDLFFRNDTFYYNRIDHRLMLIKGTLSVEKYDCNIEIKGGRFLYGDYGIGFGVSRIFNEIEIGFNAVRTKDDLAGNVCVYLPLFPRDRKTLAKYGIGPVKHFNFRYWYYSNKLGHEPQISTSLRNIEGIAGTNHFRYMNRDK